MHMDFDWIDLPQLHEGTPRATLLIATTLKRSGEVCLRDLDRTGREAFNAAKLVEIKSWSRYEA
eukprot:5846996-Prorocentrum_lima.AAC.1